MKDLKRRAREILSLSKYRMTQSRVAILNAILEQKAPFSAQRLLALVSRKAKCDPVTIYRTLSVFVDLGLIEKCDFSEESAMYEVLLGKSGQHHHHIVCKSCKKVEALNFCLVNSQEQALQRLGYTALTHRLEFSGMCPVCS